MIDEFKKFEETFPETIEDYMRGDGIKNEHYKRIKETSFKIEKELKELKELILNLTDGTSCSGCKASGLCEFVCACSENRLEYLKRWVSK